MENDELLRKQMIFLAERRSMAEMEQLLTRFLAERLDSLEGEECRRIIALLHYADADLLDWLSGIKEPQAGVDREALRWISRHCSPNK